MDFFEIKYDSGAVEKVRRVKRKQLKDLIILQQDLLAAFLKHNASVGSIIADDGIWSSIEKICSLLPVVGTDQLGVDIAQFEDDITQLTRIFFTESIDENGLAIPLNKIEGDWYKPSLISKLHQLDYYGSTQEAVKKLQPEASK